MTSTKQTGKHLEKLKGSDFEIKDGEPDIRGWDVKDRDGNKVGEVDDLIFDVQARKVRYMVVDTNNNDYKIDRKHILVPIGLAELHTSDDDVYLPGVSAEQVKGYPEYSNEDITDEHETAVRNLFPVNDPGSIGEAGVALNQSDRLEGYYNNDLFNESNLFKNRRKSINDEEDAIIKDLDEEVVENNNSYVKAKKVNDPNRPTSDFSGGDL